MGLGDIWLVSALAVVWSQSGEAGGVFLCNMDVDAKIQVEGKM